ncbi:hypothetical protein Tco_1042861 [Tanacetum coccineum]|uniref:Uncharacterized protein n=1 Tax=Tanacetum coccineum TaxID=301880 RepID=A0ABQ5GLQ0_9ASTR
MIKEEGRNSMYMEEGFCGFCIKRRRRKPWDFIGKNAILDVLSCIELVVCSKFEIMVINDLLDLPGQNLRVREDAQVCAATCYASMCHLFIPLEIYSIALKNVVVLLMPISSFPWAKFAGQILSDLSLSIRFEDISSSSSRSFSVVLLTDVHLSSLVVVVLQLSEKTSNGSGEKNFKKRIECRGKGTFYPEPCPFAANNILEVAEDYHVAAIDAIEAG